jgi:hypothetical protein
VSGRITYCTTSLLAATLLLAAASAPAQDYYAYDGRVLFDVKRDRIMAIAEDYATLRYYMSSANATAQCPGVSLFDTTPGWKTGTKYCWGGETTTKQFRSGLAVPLSAGNINTGGTSSYGQCAVGEDCSGFVSNAWTSARYATSSFSTVANNIAWENLRMGDAMNDAGSHIRLFDYYLSNVGTAMLYESTSGSGLYWKNIHRSLARDNGYQPIRYNKGGSYNKVVDYPEPEILYIRRTGTERMEVRWDGQADHGFRLYQSTDATNWTMIRDFDKTTSLTRICEVSGLLPDRTCFYRITSLNSAGETGFSNVVTYRLDGNALHRVLLVDGYDRYREQATGSRNALLVRYGNALASRGVGYDFCKNEAVVDNCVSLTDYAAVVWMLGEETTFDETFSWAEQMHLTTFLDGGGRLFVSGAEIGWDIDNRADSTTYKNGSPNDRPFYNNYLRASYVGDDAQTYQAQGAAGTIFAGLSFSFDNGTQGTYDVVYPDQVAAYGGSTVGMTYQGGLGGNACVYSTSPTSGTVIHMAFPFETIYPESARNSVMKAGLNYFNLAASAPAMKSARQTAADAITVTWAGHASVGFRLFQKTGAGSWVQVRSEAQLNSDADSVALTGLSPGTRYAFKVQAVNASGAGADSDVAICSAGSSGEKILVVDGYDRWNSQVSQSGGANHALLEKFADALSATGCRYDSCANECVVEGAVALGDYTLVMYMCGEESTESEAFSAAEQLAVENFLKAGGKLFVSGAEIGWDLTARANTLNEYSNGSPNDQPFYNNCLKTSYVSDDANVYSARGAAGSIFDGVTFSFDNGTQGTYDVEYPDVIAPTGGSTTVLLYGSGSNVAGVVFEGTVSGGTAPARVLSFGFPFETIYDATARTNVMGRLMTFMVPVTLSRMEME